MSAHVEATAHVDDGDALIVEGLINGDTVEVECFNGDTGKTYREAFPASRLGKPENLKTYCEVILAQWQYRIGRGLVTPWSDQAD